jgi:hypothetical protein
MFVEFHFLDFRSTPFGNLPTFLGSIWRADIEFAAVLASSFVFVRAIAHRSVGKVQME